MRMKCVSCFAGNTCLRSAVRYENNESYDYLYCIVLHCMCIVLYFAANTKVAQWIFTGSLKRAGNILNHSY